MKLWAKGGLIGFVAVFVGLFLVLLLTGHDESGWRCLGLYGPTYCSFASFVFSPFHIAFLLFYSWVGFFAGIIDVRMINKKIREKANDPKLYLRITSIITMSLVIVFAVVGLLAFENWVEIMIYSIVFAFFVIFLSWVVEKIKYH
jgi:hypothetical protein